MKIKKINQSAGVIANVIDSLESNSSIDALSANMGKELYNNSITTSNSIIETLNTKVGVQYRKNYLNKNKLHVAYAWQATTSMNSETKTIYGTCTATSGVSYLVTNRFFLKAGTYTFSMSVLGQFQILKILGQADTIIAESSNPVVTFTLEQDDLIYFMFYIWCTSTSNTIEISNMQIELGENKTEIQEYLDNKIIIKNNNKQLNEIINIDNMLQQTNGRRYMHDKRWYRIAYCTQSGSPFGLIRLGTEWNNLAPMTVLLSVLTCHKEASIKLLDQLSHSSISTQHFTQVRVQLDENTDTYYLDVYYNLEDATNYLRVDIVDSSNDWKITPNTSIKEYTTVASLNILK